MTIRLATFNVENLFQRAKALNVATWEEGQPVLAAFDRFNTVAMHETYSDEDKASMLADLETLGVLERDGEGHLVTAKDPFGAWALLRENRGDFLKQPHGADAVIVADGRGDWIGWVDLVAEAVDEIATRMTARVITDVGAQIQCLVEAESRPALVRFNEQLLNKHFGHVMLIDGNDPRGIDVGLFAAKEIEISSVRSHVDDRDDHGHTLFSRDCPIYQLRLPGGQDLYLLINHFKSQSFTHGNPDILRTKQSTRVREIYDQLRADGAALVAILGDFNKGPSNDDPPKHPSLERLFDDPANLVDTATLPVFDTGPRPGTFQSCTLRNRLDYILVSPDLAQLVSAGGVFRKGLWGDAQNVHPPKDWEIYPEITASRHAASDHAAVWLDLNV